MEKGRIRTLAPRQMRCWVRKEEFLRGRGSEQLNLVELDLAAALLADIREERIVNFMPVEKLVGWAVSASTKTAISINAHGCCW